jgi:hypothetical protein
MFQKLTRKEEYGKHQIKNDNNHKGADPPTLLICFSHPPPPLIISHSERINVRIWVGATLAANKVRTRSFTSLVILRWDGCTASRLNGGWLCSLHFTRNVQLPTWLRRPYRRKGQPVRTELEGRWRVSSVRSWRSSRVPNLPQCSNRTPIL